MMNKPMKPFCSKVRLVVRLEAELGLVPPQQLRRGVSEGMKKGIVLTIKAKPSRRKLREAGGEKRNIASNSEEKGRSDRRTLISDCGSTLRVRLWQPRLPALSAKDVLSLRRSE